MWTQAPPPPPSSPPAAPRRASADGAASGFGKEAAAVRQAPVDPGARFTLDEEETGDGDDDEGQGGAAGPGGEREAAAEGGAEGGREAADALTQEAVEAVEQVVADALKAPGASHGVFRACVTERPGCCWSTPAIMLC